MKKMIFYLLVFCAFGQVKSANKDTSYNLADYTQSITITVQKEYGLALPEAIECLLLKFVPNNKYQKNKNKYQTSKVYLANVTQTDMLQEEIKVYSKISSDARVELIYDQKLKRYYFWTPPYSGPFFHYKLKHFSELRFESLYDLCLTPNDWYKAELEAKNAQNPTKKITLSKSKLCIYNDTGQLSIDLNDYEKHIEEETIYIHPECTTQEIIDSIVLHLRNQSEDRSHPLYIKPLFQSEVTAKKLCYTTLMPSDVPRSTFRDPAHCLNVTMSNQSATMIMESYEESLYDVLKKKKSATELGCCEKMQKHKNTIGMSLLSITVTGLAYYANFAS